MAKLNSKLPPKLALVGSETLLGKELEEIIKSRLPEAQILTFSAGGEGNFAEEEGEAVYVEPLEANAIRDVKAIVLAGSAAGAQKAYDLSKQAGGKPVVIDASGYLDHLPEARVVSPLEGEVDVRQGWLFSTAHPAAGALALTLRRAARYGLKQAIVNIFEPASEYGKKGISALHQQTASLLAFKPVGKELFDAQLSFNLLARYGEEADHSLSSTERRIATHLAEILREEKSAVTIPIPSIRLIAAPVFHGYSMSVWLEFETTVTALELGEALASAQIEVRGPSDEAPDNVSAANQSGLIAGDIRMDDANPRAAWLWLVGDNVRLTADAAADVMMALEEQTA